MTPRSLWACALLVPLCGCTVSARTSSGSQGPSNACTSDDDCDGGNCAENICQTVNGRFESLLLEVTPTVQSGLPLVPFLQLVEDLPGSGGDRDISLAQASRVTGHLKPNDKPGCVRTFLGPTGNQLAASTDGMSLPVSVTLTPRDGLLGLPTQVYVADATLPTLNQGTVEYTFELQIPVASYDMYIVPVAHQVESTDPNVPPEECRIPPQLFRLPREKLGNTTLFDYPAGVTRPLALEVVFPQAAGNLDGWVVDVIEPLSGKPISSERVLSDPTVVTLPDLGRSLSYQASVVYSVVTELGQFDLGVEGANDLVRLRPPSDVVAPTIFLDRLGLGLFDSLGPATIDDLTRFPTAVTVQGQMTAEQDGAPATGRVDLISTAIFGVNEGIFASFQTSVLVDERGFFEVVLPPGSYKAYGVPLLGGDSQLAVHQAQWEVPEGVAFQAGRLIELPFRTELKGRTSLPSAEIHAVASPQSVIPFNQAFGAAAFVPRATPGLVDAAGRFVVQADPGSFDITARPPETSGFAWSVRPRVSVQPSNAEQELPRLDPTRPSLMRGTVQIGSGSMSPVVPLALIRAYAYLDENLAYTGDPRAARSVIQVAQARTDEAGRFQLLVPEDFPK